MSLRPEIVFVKALLPHRSINFAPTNEGEITMASDKSRLLQLAERREERLATRSPWPKRAVALGGVAVAIAGTGVAYAAWTTSGNGTASAKAATMSQPTTSTVDMSAVTSGLLSPGSTGDVSITVNNPNGFDVKVTGVALQTGQSVTADAGHSGCTTTGVTFTNQSPTASNAVAKNSSATFTYAGAVSMSAASLSACQGATFSIPITVTVSS